MTNKKTIDYGSEEFYSWMDAETIPEMDFRIGVLEADIFDFKEIEYDDETKMNKNIVTDGLTYRELMVKIRQQDKQWSNK